MKHLARDFDKRLVQAEAMLYGQPWKLEHIKATKDFLRSGYVQNSSRFDRQNGEGTYSRLWLAFVYGAWRLEEEGAIHPHDFEIIEAYYALPRRTFSLLDDGIDFETPARRLRLALTMPLDMTGVEEYRARMEKDGQ